MPQCPIFIVGAPRSGTTLLRNILNRHPRLAVCGETHFLPLAYARRRAFGDLRDPKKRQHLIDQYLSTDHAGKMGVNLSELRAKLEREATGYREFFLCMLQCYAEAQRKPRCGEKTPRHAYYAETLLDWFPRASLIHLERDPRDTVASLQGMPWAPGSVVNNARLWLRHNEAATRCENRPGYLRVRYECLVDRPEDELRKICRHLNEDYLPEMLIPNDESERMSERKVTTDRKGRWRDVLTEDQVALIEWFLGSKLESFGYERTVRQPSAAAKVHGLSHGVYDSIRGPLKRFPAGWYRLVRPSQIAKEESWLWRRVR